MNRPDGNTDALGTLSKYFGYESFRFNQAEVIDRTLDLKSSLVIMPTGGGKSICYQLPAVLLDGLTIVVSPLIALMQDQVSALKANGISAEALNSTCSDDEERIIRDRVEQGDLKLLYVSPERAVSWSFIQWIKTLNVAQIAIDEAHCVSVWGNDFRPEYTRLPELTSLFSNVPVVALTATADTATQQDIKHQLQLIEAETFVSSFERKNIEIDVLPAKNRIKTIIEFVEGRPNQPGIVYCLSRKGTEDTASKLRQAGFRAAHYHGAMNSEVRTTIQDQFIRDELQIVCATIAFGMGIDKPNIGWVIHHNLPKNIESYYQEIGRAGRDGQPAQALLFAGYGDMKNLTKFIDDSGANETFKQVQYAKLERMWEFSQTLSCRTNFILNYFGEYREKTCGHCDHCLNPPKAFDGTVIAQKALSACLRINRLNKSVGLRLLVDVLRGSRNQGVLENGFDAIQTYGAGADISWQDWMHYLTQLIDKGYLAIDFTRSNALTLTTLSRDVLAARSTVMLSEPSDFDAQKPAKKRLDTDLNDNELELFEALKTLRRQLADQAGVQAYTIFADASLKDMAKKKPGNDGALLKVSGVGEYKCEKYGEAFISLICSHVPEEDRLISLLNKTVKRATSKQRSDFVMPKLSETHLETLTLFKQGSSVPEAAKARGFNTSTITGHLFRLAYYGEAVPVANLITDQQIERIQSVWAELDKPNKIKPVFEKCDHDIEWEQVRYAVCLALKDQESAAV